MGRPQVHVGETPAERHAAAERAYYHRLKDNPTPANKKLLKKKAYNSNRRFYEIKKRREEAVNKATKSMRMKLHHKEVALGKEAERARDADKWHSRAIHQYRKIKELEKNNRIVQERLDQLIDQRLNRPFPSTLSDEKDGAEDKTAETVDQMRDQALGEGCK